MSATEQSGSGGNLYSHLQEKVTESRGVPCDECARQRATCSRRWAPGGPPACEKCAKKRINCTWNTVGNRGRIKTDVNVTDESMDEEVFSKDKGGEKENTQKVRPNCSSVIGSLSNWLPKHRVHFKVKGSLQSQTSLTLIQGFLSFDNLGLGENSANMVLKLRKSDCETEDPWRYMADLPLEHDSTMRRVMVLIYHKLNPTVQLNLPSKFSYVYLTKKERKRVKVMLQESNNNDLLVEMLQWFSAQHMAEDEEIVNATQTLRSHVVNAVRQPRLYQVEFLKERDKWTKFIGKPDVEIGGVGGLSTTASRPIEFITSVNQALVGTSATQQPVVTSTSNEALSKERSGKGLSLTVNNYDITDEDASTATDLSSDEEINIFLDTMLPGSPKKTRSGIKFATSSQESPKQTMGSALRGGKGKTTPSRVNSVGTLEE